MHFISMMSSSGWFGHSRMCVAVQSVDILRLICRLTSVWLLALLLPSLSVATTPPVRSHALLVGVSDYPHLDAGAQLLGPRNDVALWREYLVEHRPGASVSVLADGVPGAKLPTRAAILAELDRLSSAVKPGDFVLLMFAGHGSQQPASQRALKDEPDGLDEIFLPRDARGWDSSKASVQNAIVDTEFKQAIDKIRQRGAFVWAIFDTCHSATMTRAVRPSTVRYRQLTPDQLGIPQQAMAQARSRAVSSASGRSTSPNEQVPAGANAGQRSASKATATVGPVGPLVAFYAAQSHQETPEFALPLGAPDAREHGVFSFTLLQALQEAPQATYQELIERVMQRFMSTAGATAVPMAEGTAMSDQVWGGQMVESAAWRVNKQAQRLVLSAGLMHDQTPGSTLKLYRSPSPDDHDVLATIVVKQARAVDAEVELLPGTGSVQELSSLPDRTYARPLDTQVEWRFQVALGQGGAARCETPSTQLQSALSLLKAQYAAGGRVRWVQPETPGVDLWLCPQGGRLAFLDAHASTDVTAPAIAIPANSSSPQDLARLIGQSIGKAVRVASVLRVAQASGSGKGIEVKAWVRAKPGAGQPACGQLDQPNPREGSKPYEPGSQMELKEGDCLSLILHNTATVPLDLTVMYVDAAYGMSALWPDAAQLFNPRIEAGAKVAIGEFEAFADSLGRDRLLVLGLPVVQASQPLSLAFLAQESLDPSVRTRGQQDPLAQLMMEAGFGGATTRSLRPARQGGQPMSALVFGLRVQPH